MRDHRESHRYTDIDTSKSVMGPVNIFSAFVYLIDFATVSNSGNTNFSRRSIEGINDTVMFSDS